MGPLIDDAIGQSEPELRVGKEPIGESVLGFGVGKAGEATEVPPICRVGGSSKPVRQNPGDKGAFFVGEGPRVFQPGLKVTWGGFDDAGWCV